MPAKREMKGISAFISPQRGEINAEKMLKLTPTKNITATGAEYLCKQRISHEFLHQDNREQIQD